MVDKYCMWIMFLLPEMVVVPSKPIPTILPNRRFLSLMHLTSAKYIFSASSFQAQYLKGIQLECHLPPKDRKLTIPPLP